VAVEGSCHCGTVRIGVPHEPRELVACDCSLCSRRGMVWAHYPEGEVGIVGYTEPYSWGDETICFCHCSKCGCTTHWHAIGERSGTMGVNARLLDGFELTRNTATGRYAFHGEPLEVRLLEGANG